MEKTNYHPAIYMLLEKFNLKLEERNASDSYTFDGKTIATHYTSNDLSMYGLRPVKDYLCRDRNNSIFYFKEKYHDDIIFYKDHDLLHEICHFIVASTGQRLLPEYGMHIGVTQAGAFGKFRNLLNENMFELDYDNLWGYNDKLNINLCLSQDYAAQLLEVYFGKKYNISPVYAIKTRLGSESWNDFYEFRIKHVIKEYEREINKYFIGNRSEKPYNRMSLADKIYKRKLKMYNL